jgi:hypothetical protein
MTKQELIRYLQLEGPCGPNRIATHFKVSTEEVTSFAVEPEFEWEEVPRLNGYMAKCLGLKRQPPAPSAPALYDITNLIVTMIGIALIGGFVF